MPYNILQHIIAFVDYLHFGLQLVRSVLLFVHFFSWFQGILAQGDKYLVLVHMTLSNFSSDPTSSLQFKSDTFVISISRGKRSKILPCCQKTLDPTNNIFFVVQLPILDAKGFKTFCENNSPFFQHNRFFTNFQTTNVFKSIKHWWSEEWIQGFPIFFFKMCV